MIATTDSFSSSEQELSILNKILFNRKALLNEVSICDPFLLPSFFGKQINVTVPMPLLSLQSSVVQNLSLNYFWWVITEQKRRLHCALHHPIWSTYEMHITVEYMCGKSKHTHFCNTPSQRTNDSTAYTKRQPCNLRTNPILKCCMCLYAFSLVLTSIHNMIWLTRAKKIHYVYLPLTRLPTPKSFPESEPFERASGSTVFRTRPTWLDLYFRSKHSAALALGWSNFGSGSSNHMSDYILQ